MALSYDRGPRIEPAIDHARVHASQGGVPMHRYSSNSQTTGRVDHGTNPGSREGRGGPGWPAHRAHYMASTSEAQQRSDQAHLGAFRQHMQATGMHPHAAQWLEHWIGQHHSFNPHLIAFMRQIGSEQSKQDQEREVARGAERDAGRHPAPPVPGHPQASTGGERQTKPGLISRAMSMYRGGA